MKKELGAEFRSHQRLGLIVAFSLMFHLFICSGLCLGETAVIPMQHRSASEALPMIQKMLSQEGRAAADTRTNQLLVIDHPESIQRLRQFLDGFDRPVKQARIRVRFQESGSLQDRAISGDAGVSGKHWSVTTGGRKEDGVEVRLRDRERVRKGTSEFFINVASGSWAYIMVAEDILYSEEWIDLCRRYAY
ncbi:MAG: secretin N-terminal domain-containing protein, partial [Desulfobacteraceae bacterium]